MRDRLRYKAHEKIKFFQNVAKWGFYRILGSSTGDNNLSVHINVNN